MIKKSISKSLTGPQWYIIEQIDDGWKIHKIFYSKERCEEYLKIENILDSLEH